MARTTRKTAARVPTETSKRSTAYSAAVRRLHEAHAGELEKLLTEEYEQVGLTYTRRRTAEERASEERAARLAKAQGKVAALVAEFGTDALGDVDRAAIEEAGTF